MDTPSSLSARLWQEVFFLSFALLGIMTILLWPSFKPGDVTFSMNVLAATSGLFLAMSFSLSSFAYYFNFLDSKVVYRKQLGLMGYFFALGYVAVAATAFPEVYIAAFPNNLWSIDVGLGALAMAILTLMALISNASAARILGGKLWKDILSLGYVAYALLVIRALFLDELLWQEWIATGDGVFTVRMILTILGTVVLLFRVSVLFHKKLFNIRLTPDITDTRSETKV